MEILFTKDLIARLSISCYNSLESALNDYFSGIIEQGKRCIRRQDGIHRLKPVFGRMHSLKPLENF